MSAAFVRVSQNQHIHADIGRLAVGVAVGENLCDGVGVREHRQVSTKLKQHRTKHLQVTSNQLNKCESVFERRHGRYLGDLVLDIL